VVRTIGVAVGIPQPWGARLDTHRLASGDPQATLLPAHLTLLGPLELAESADQGAIEGHLATVAASHRAFPVRLHGTGTFRPLTQVVFVAVAGGFEDCVRLAADVRSGPLAKELEYPYHPHVTVAHDVEPAALDAVFAELAGFEAQFPVDDFTLYEHGADGRWRPLRAFRLAPA
jgi:2'-5' RNA ligase